MMEEQDEFVVTRAPKPIGDWHERLDPGIRLIVDVLRQGGVETYESCEGGDGHAFPEPTVLFHGAEAAGWHALGVALDHALPVTYLKRRWNINKGAPTGPAWEMVFYLPSESRRAQ